MDYFEAVEKINSLLTFGIKPGLDRVKELIRRIGSPDKDLRFVHIAGTNGKGSTCAFISAALSRSGYKTGRFISPYVLEFRERFMIDGEMIPKQTLADIVSELFPVVENMRNEGMVITEFEFIFAAALVWFKREKCDIVVLETGLGGRFDATNMIEAPLCIVITSISLDHTKILGNTYAEIAFEKCGIIKPDGICVAYARQDSSAMDVIRSRAAEMNNRLVIADGDAAEIISASVAGTEFLYKGQKLSIRLIGEHMVRNAVTAFEALYALRDRGINVPDKAIKESFAEVSFPARMEVLSLDPLVILDGAHNPDGAKALSEAIKKYLPDKKKTAVVGMLMDKDVETSLSYTIPLFDKVIAVEPDNPRKMTAKALKSVVKQFCNNVTVCSSHAEAYHKAVRELDDGEILVIFGSLYLASDMRRIVIGDE